MNDANTQRMTNRTYSGRSNATRRRVAVRATLRPDSIATVLAQWSRQRPGLDLGPLGMFIALAHAYWLTAPRIEQLMADHGITRGIFDVLTTLRRAGTPHTLAPRQIARSLLLSGAGLTSRLDRLEADKLIVRLPDPHDGRGLKVRLTPKGTATGRQDSSRAHRARSRARLGTERQANGAAHPSARPVGGLRAASRQESSAACGRSMIIDTHAHALDAGVSTGPLPHPAIRTFRGSRHGGTFLRAARRRRAGLAR